MPVSSASSPTSFVLESAWPGPTVAGSLPYEILPAPSFPVESVSELLSVPVTSSTTGTQVGLAGYSTPGDGGGGTLIQSSGTLASYDLGINFPAISGRFTRPLDGVIHSKWFGVKHDGTGDQSQRMQAFINAVISVGETQGYTGFIDAGHVNCNGETLYINSNGTATGGAVLNRSFRGAGRSGTIIQNATLSVGDINSVIIGSGPAGSSVFLSSFALQGYLDLWSLQTASILDRISVANPASIMKRAYTSGTPPLIAGSKLDESLCNIYYTLQLMMHGVSFQAGAVLNPSTKTVLTPSTNAVRINAFTNLSWIGGGCFVTFGDLDGGQVGLLMDSMGLPIGDNVSGELLTLRGLHFEGQRQEAIYIKGLRCGEINADVRTYASKDIGHASIQIGDRQGIAPNIPSDVTVRGCYGASNNGLDTFLQANFVESITLRENSCEGFATAYALGSNVGSYVLDPTNEVLAVGPSTTSAGVGMAAVTPTVFVGSIASVNVGGLPTSTTLSLPSGTTTTLSAGQMVVGGGVAVGTLITGSSTASTYTLNLPQTVPSTTLSALPTSASLMGYASGSSLTVTEVESGTLAVGQTLVGIGITNGAIIISQTTNSDFPGGAGNYALNGSQMAGTSSAPVSLLTLVPAVSGGGVATGMISGTSLSINTPSGTFSAGQIVTGAGVSSGTIIVSSTGLDTYSVTPAQNFPPAGATFVATIVGNTMSVGQPTSGSGPLSSGQFIAGPGVSAGSQIGSQVSGTPGSTGVYNVSPSQTVAPAETVTGVISGTTLVVGAVQSGVITPGQFVAGTGVTSGTAILSAMSGTSAGGPGSYALNSASTVATPVAAVSGSITSTVLTAGVPSSGTLAAGQIINGGSVSAGTFITSQITGTAGGAGTYGVNNSQNVGGESLTMLADSLAIQGATLSAVTAASLIAQPTAAAFTGSISNTSPTPTLTVSSVIEGALAPGQLIVGAGVAGGTYVEAPLAGGYIVTNSQNVGGPGSSAVPITLLPTAAVVSGGISSASGGGYTLLSVTSTVSGALDVGQLITGAGVSPFTTVAAVLSSGAAYTISPAQSSGTSSLRLTALPTVAQISGSISGTILTISQVISGTVGVGQVIMGPGIAAGTEITSFVNGTGSSGRFHVNNTYSTPVSGTMFLTPVAAVGSGYVSNVGAPSGKSVLSLTSVASGLPALDQTVIAGGSTVLSAGTMIVSASSGPGTYATPVQTENFNIAGPATRSYYDNIADAPISLGALSSIQISLSLQNRRDYSLTLSLAGHQIDVLTGTFEIPADYTLLLSKLHSTDSIASWGPGFLFPGGVAPTLATMTVNQQAKVMMKAVTAGSPPSPSLLCDCVIYGTP